MGRDFRFYGERPVRDSTLILKVDDLINIATGSKDKNVVDLKMLQFILYILAGHVSILEQMVEMRIPMSGELLTMEDEYYDDIKRRGGAPKRSEEDKKRATGGKQDIETRLDKDTDIERKGAKDDEYGRGHARRAEGKERQGKPDEDRGNMERTKSKKGGVKDDDYDEEIRRRQGREEKSREKDEESKDSSSSERYEKVGTEDYDYEGRQEKVIDEKGKGRDVDKYDIDKERIRKASDSNVEYEKEAKVRSYDEVHGKKYSTHRGRSKKRGDYDEDSDEDDGRKGKDVDDRGRGRVRKRTRSLDIEIPGRGRRGSGDESLDKNDQRHGSLGRTERQGIPIKLPKEDKHKIHEKFSDTRDEIAKKTQGNDVGSFLVQVKQKRISPGRDGQVRGETGRVRGDKSGKHRQYDADSAGGGGRDDKYQEGSGRKERNLGDDRGGNERGVGGHPLGGGGGGGGGRDWDDGHRRRRKCDTGKRRKGAKTDEDDDDEEELKKLRERNESFEAGGLWQCTGRKNQDSFEETEGILVADSKGNMRFVPLGDGKKKEKGRRDEKSYKDRGKDDRVRYDRDVRRKDYDKDERGRGYRDDRSDDEDRYGRGRAGDRDRWDDRDVDRRGGKYDDRDDRDGRDRDRDRDDKDSGKYGARGVWDREDGDDRYARGGRKGERDDKRGIEDKGRDGRYGVDDEVRDGRYGKEYDRDGRHDGTTGRDREGKGEREGRYDRKSGRGDRDGRGGTGFSSDSESDEERDGRKGYKGGRTGRGRYDDGTSGRSETGKDRRGTKGYRDGDDWVVDDERGRGRRDGGRDGKVDTRSGDDDYDVTDKGSDKDRGRVYAEEGSYKEGKYRVDGDRDGRDNGEGEKRGTIGKDDREGGRYDDRDKKWPRKGSRDDDKYTEEKGKYDDYGADKGRRGVGESLSGDDQDSRRRVVDRDFEEHSADEEGGRREKRSKDDDRDDKSGKVGGGKGGKGGEKDEEFKSGEADSASIKSGERGGKGRDKGGKEGRGEGGESDEDEHDSRKRTGYDEEGEGKSGRKKGDEDEKGKEGYYGVSDEDEDRDGRGGKRKRRADSDEGKEKGGRGKKGYYRESDQDGGTGGRVGKKGIADGEDGDGKGGRGKGGDSDEDDGRGGRDGKRKGRVDGDKGEGKSGQGKEGYYGQSDDDDGRGGKGEARKGKVDGDESDGKTGRGKEKYSEEADEDDGKGGKARKKTGKEKGDLEDEDLKGKGGKGKGTAGDVDEDGVRDDQSAKKGDKDRKGKEKDAISISSKGEKDTGRDTKGRDTESLSGKEDKRKGGKGKEGDEDVDESGRKGRDKDAESISSKGGKDKYGADAVGKDSKRLTDKGGKRKGGKGGDDYDDEDDTGGRGGASKGTSKGKAGDKGAAGQKGLKGRDASLTSVATGASIGKGGKGVAGKPGGVSREGSTPRVGSIEVVTRTQFHELEKAVEELQKKAGPMAPPIMPDNKRLLNDISMGNASLTDVIQALQLQARLQAAERAIDRMADLIAQLAAAGALTPEMLAKVAAIHSEVEQGYKDVPLGPGGKAELAKQLQKRIAEGSKVDPTRISMTFGGLGTTGTTGTAATTGAGRPGGAAAGVPGTGRRVSVPPSTSARPSSSGKGSKLPGMMLERFARLPTGTGSTLSAGIPSMRSGKSLGSEDCITAPEMDAALQALREEFERTIAVMTTRANNSAEHASQTAKNVAEKLDTALQLTDRLSNLYNMVDDYTEQLNGFDAGVTTQIEGFQQQMTEMKNDLIDGLEQLQNVNNNAETAAVLELTERYDGLVADLDMTLHHHQNMNTQQNQLGDELRSLLECVEMLRESKADRDEVLDGLRDKADISRLDGLLTEEGFAQARAELELRMRMCYDKFRAQDNVWMGAVKDFSNVICNKAEVMQLMGTRDDMQEQLHQLNRKCIQLTKLLGDPKAAVLARKLAKDGTCAACKIPALMEPTDISTIAPPALPAMRKKRPEPTGADSDVCLKDVSRIPTTAFPPPSDVDEEPKDVHMCKRWVGGSHTLLTSQVTRERAPAPAHALPTRRYVGHGTDGKLYMMAEACIPCVECNTLYTEKIPGEIEVSHGTTTSAASDITVVTGTEARRVTVISEKDLLVQAKVEDKDEKLPSMVERQSATGERRSSMIGKRLSMAERPSLIEKQFAMAEKRPSKTEKRMSTLEKTSERTSDATEKSVPLVDYKLKGKDSVTGFEDQIPKKISDIGFIVKGRVTLVDEEAARRAEVRYETSRLEALQAGDQAEDAEKDGTERRQTE